MAKAIGANEVVIAVTIVFDQEFQEELSIPYMAAAKWNGKDIGFQSAAKISGFLVGVQKRLRAKFKPAANKLVLNPGKAEVASLYAQSVQNSVIYVAGEVMKVMAVNKNAKVR